MHDRAHPRAVGQLLLTAFLWSFGGLLIKAVDWPPLAVAGGRGAVAALFLYLLNRGQLRFTFAWSQLLPAITYAVFTISFVAATKLTTAANAILLQYTAPIWIALGGAWFLGERATRSDWLTIAAVLGGMALFFADGLVLAHVWGNLIAIFSGVAFAALAMLLRRQKDSSPLESLILGNTLACVCGLPWMLTAPPPSLTGIGALVVLGVVQLGCSYWLYTRAIKHVTALEAVLIPVIEPVLNPVWVFFARGERPSTWALVGGGIVLGAVTWRAVHSLRALRPPAPAGK
ncbi:MAG: DMT family transporter [Opitutae bacterium]|nr:DMT family transporter [Opitutae bacterium]